MARNILVAEDEPIVAFDLCDTVEEAGFAVEGPYAASSSALIACQKRRPDLAILDIELEDGEAYALAQKLADENVPIIFHSGRHTPEEVQQNFPSAITLTKPCPPARLLESVNQALAAV